MENLKTRSMRPGEASFKARPVKAGPTGYISPVGAGRVNTSIRRARPEIDRVAAPSDIPGRRRQGLGRHMLFQPRKIHRCGYQHTAQFIMEFARKHGFLALRDALNMGNQTGERWGIFSLYQLHYLCLPRWFCGLATRF
jgi:hypothetical protein